MPGRKKRALDSDMIDNELEDTGGFSDDGDEFDDSETDEDWVNTSESDSSDLDMDSGSESDSSDAWVSVGLPRPKFPYTSDDGVQFQLIDNNDTIELFEKFIDEDLINLIVRETNRYARQFIVNHAATLKPNSRVHQWKETNANEIRTLLGLLVLQGIVSKPDHHLYFTNRESIATPFFSRIMGKNRFIILLKFLHFVDNETMIENVVNRKLFKIQPIIDHCKTKFQALYIPEKNISIDESLLGWKGRLGWKQYIPSKRKRFGMKMYELCDSKTGYVWNFIFYTGADTIYGENFPGEAVTPRIVLELTHDLLDKGYTLYLDNFYTSPELVDKLCERKTDCVGTMRLNKRGVPESVKVANLKKGETVAAFRKKQMVLKWKDKKDVTLVSTTHDNSMVRVEKRHHIIEKPAVVLDYNKQMGGVDLADNYLHYYAMSRNRLKKYYMKIFRHLMDICALNAYQIYKKIGGRKKRLEFLIDLGEQLVAKYATPLPRLGRPSTTPIATRLVERHFLEPIPPTPKKERPAKRCRVCYKGGLRKESTYWCPDCKVGLCMTPCFRIYHTVNNY